MSNARNLARLLPNASGQLPDAAMASGSVLQVVSVAKTDVSSTSSTSFVDAPGLSVTLTPLSANSKFLVIAQLAISGASGNHASFARLNRNGTDIYLSSNAGAQTPALGMNEILAGEATPRTYIYQDSPATSSAVTYKITFRSNTGVPVYFNRSNMDNNEQAWSRSTSSLTVLEVSA